MSVEIIVKSQGVELKELEQGQTRCVVHEGGVSLDRRTPMYSSSVPIKGPVPLLQPHEPHCQIHCRPIPEEMLGQAVGFFRAAGDQHGGEAALVLLHNPATGEFRWHCPEQTIRMYQWWGKYYAEDSVEYENPLELPAGFVQFGDAHSHIGAPIPSYVDKNDEAHLDGLHIIIGNIHSRPSWHVDFAIDGMRFTVPQELILESLPEAPYPDPDPEWMSQIKIVYPKKKKEKTSSSYGNSNYGSSNYGSSYGSYGSSHWDDD